MKIVANNQRLEPIFILCLFVLFVGNIFGADYAKWVNPFIGTGGHGHTFPGATMPFGMVQLSPDTRIDNWDGSSGYHYSDDTIFGFSHTHLSGTGIPDYCDILFMPTVGEPQFFAKEGDKAVNGYASKFSHANEKAEPGYYSVKLDDDGILAEMTATRRGGLHRYTFPKSDKAYIILDLNWRDKPLEVKAYAVGDTRVEGSRRSSSWAKDQIIYFVAEFSKSIGQRPELAISSGTQTGFQAAYPFKTNAGEQILVKVAISSVSIEGARKNLAAELPGWDFDKVRADAKAAWNKELSKIEVSGGTDAQTTTFYTALYHTMIQPNVFNDVDGSYTGHDKKIHNIRDDARSPGFSRFPSAKKPPKGGTPSSQYTVFSLWDTFRAAHPLYTIIDQKRTVDFINTFIRQYEQGGRLPVWELWGEETDTMIGYHAVSVIADAMAKGIKGFDYEKAYAAAKHSAELDHFGLAAYKKRGYISMEDENESVSKTLEYAYNDFCISQMALLLGSKPVPNNPLRRVPIDDKQKGAKYDKESDEYLIRSRSFENFFDPETGFMRPKKNGGFVKPFLPNEVTFHFTEGNSWQYTFFVPHNIPRLMQLMGGREKFAAKLDELFTTSDKLAGRFQPDITGLIGQYAHGNEPSHHITYLYNDVGEHWKTQRLVRQIMDDFYKPEPDGLIGNEDCGQMSAWYILSASGFYPVLPGVAYYDLGTPLFREVKYNLENGKTFTVKAPNVSSKNYYVKLAKLNGKTLTKPVLPHREIMTGGVIEFEMTDTPAKSAYGTIKPDEEEDGFVAVPIIDGGSRVFGGQTTVTLSTTTNGAKIVYMVNGAEKHYTGPFTIDETSTVRAKAIVGEDKESLISEATFLKKPNNWTVKIEHKYNRQYTGGGDEGLIDGIRGTINFASGEWQGYQPKDLIATIDLQRETEIKRVGGGFLQNARSWIWMPTRIEFEVSSDGVNFTRVADIKTDIAPDDMKEQMRDYVQKITPVKARYVRVHAYNLGKIPSWHPGAGDDAFIFVDEIIIQ